MLKNIAPARSRVRKLRPQAHIYVRAARQWEAAWRADNTSTWCVQAACDVPTTVGNTQHHQIYLDMKVPRRFYAVRDSAGTRSADQVLHSVLGVMLNQI